VNKAVGSLVLRWSVVADLNKLRGLRRWRQVAAVTQAVTSSRLTIQRLEDDHQRKLQRLGTDVNQLHSCQADLERQISGFLQKEKEYKEAIKKLNDRKRQTEEGSKDSYDEFKDNSSDGQLRELEQEHQELVERLGSVEVNVVSFIGEMSSLLEVHESTLYKPAGRKRTTLTNFAFK
jgi:DNA repair exonuclease SbcCD ATPase subunit